MRRAVHGLSHLCRDSSRQHYSVSSNLSLGASRKRCQTRNEACLLSAILTKNTASSSKFCAEDVDDDLLFRCRPYGITSRLQLDRESSLDQTSEKEKLLVDDNSHRQDLNLWNILVDYRLRHYGSNGAATIWRGLKYRGPRVSLESEDDLTTGIWQKLLRSAAEHNDLSLTKRLCERNGLAWRRPKLFAETITTLLRAGRDSQVSVMCDRLKAKYRNGIVDILDLYSTFQPKHHSELKAFCSVYDKVRPGKMYGKGVMHLFEQSRPADAFLLHKFLISRGDFPSSFSEIEPFMKHLARRHEDPGPFLRNLAACGVVFSGQGRRIHEHESLEVALKSSGDTSVARAGINVPSLNKVSDTFAAKAFAAKALSFEFVLNTLRAFGLTEIGPQSIREVGLAAANMDGLSGRLAKLDELGIDTGGSAYSRFIRKVCSARDNTLLRQALHTDMHHEVFEDTHLQQRLLIDSFNKCDWPKVNLLLAILNNGQILKLDGFIKIAFLSSIVDDDSKTRSFLTMLSNLKQVGFRLPPSLFRDLTNHLISHLLNAKRIERLSRIEYSNRARTTAGILQDLSSSGEQPDQPQWKVLIGQLGKSGALKEVHKLATWLAVWHSEHVERFVGEGHFSTTDLNSLNWIFDFKFQGAITHWALREQFYGKSSRVRHPWQNMLALLQYLESDCGVSIHLPTIRKVIVLFVRGLCRRSASGLRARRSDTRKLDSRRLCFKLFKMLDEIWLHMPRTAPSERTVATRYLEHQKPQLASDAAIAARPTLRLALRRFPILRHNTIGRSH